MPEASKNYFTVLGLQPNATLEEIKKAFKEVAFQYHPDRNPHNPWAEERFKEAVEAYTYLTGNLEAYRALQQPAPRGSKSAEVMEDILKVLFDIETAPAATRPRPLKVPLELSLQEAFAGGSRKLQIEREDICSACFGKGVEKGAKVFTCTYCFGMGEVSTNKEGTEKRECPKCNGRGLLSSRGCLSCRARGTLTKRVTLQVDIPPRVNEGQVLNMRGEGHEQNYFGKRGDLQFIIHLKNDPLFTFDGKDIICETTVEMSDAALGGEIFVPTLSGPTKFKLPPGTQSGQVIRLKGLGLGGDQFIKIRVKTPIAVSEKDRQLFRQIKGSTEEGDQSLWQRLKKWFW
jgi:molecular chaperone DnaJ